MRADELCAAFGVSQIRYMPREVREIAYPKGLIPNIPADRAADDD